MGEGVSLRVHVSHTRRNPTVISYRTTHITHLVTHLGKISHGLLPANLMRQRTLTWTNIQYGTSRNSHSLFISQKPCRKETGSVVLSLDHEVLPCGQLISFAPGKKPITPTGRGPNKAKYASWKVARKVGLHPGFSSNTRLGVSMDASQSKDYPPAQVLIYTPGLGCSEARRLALTQD